LHLPIIVDAGARRRASRRLQRLGANPCEDMMKTFVAGLLVGALACGGGGGDPAAPAPPVVDPTLTLSAPPSVAQPSAGTGLPSGPAQDQTSYVPAWFRLGAGPGEESERSLPRAHPRTRGP